MTEFEVYEALNASINSTMLISQFQMATLTGYLLIAFFIGERLTIFLGWSR